MKVVSTPVAPLSEVAVLSAAALGFVSSLLPWYQGNTIIRGTVVAIEINAWESGYFASLSIIALQAAALVVLISGATAIRPATPRCWPWVFKISVSSAVCLLGQWISTSGKPSNNTSPRGSLGGATEALTRASLDRGVGFYLALFVILTAAIVAQLELKRAWTS